MPMTMDQLQGLVRGQDLKYFVDPDRPALLLTVQGLHGIYRFVILLQDDGEFLQFRSLTYLHCTTGHRHLSEVLKVLGEINITKRLVKFGWDPSDGEIIAYADVWILDGTLTSQQFARMLENYLPTIDLGYGRIKATLESGTDPGEEDPAQSLEVASGGLPAELRKLLAALRGGGADDETDEEDDEPGYETICAGIGFGVSSSRPTAEPHTLRSKSPTTRSAGDFLPLTPNI